MHILVSNDDGVYAPGIKILAKFLSEIAKVTVVAPDRNRSAASHSLTLERPLRARKTEEGFFAVNGTPTDCVHLALTGLLDSLPDMVVSGINHGSNLGDDVLYSGTVAAAVEGRHLGYPTMAVSLCGDNPEHFETAAEISKQIVLRMQKESLPKEYILNLNVPDISLSELKGIKVSRLGHRHLAEPVVPARDPRGNPIYWVGPPGACQDAGPDTDFFAIANKYAAVTPLKIDMTNYQALTRVGSWFEGLSE